MEYMIENVVKAKIVLKGKDGKVDTIPETGLKFDDAKAWNEFRALAPVKALLTAGELKAVAA